MKYYGKISDPKDWVTKEYADAKQAKITASGLLKGDGNGGVSAATAGTDYVTPAQLSKFRCNKNFLDNWYFVGGGSQLGDGVFPINQRGQTTYIGGSVYGIDRWYNYQGAVTTNIASNGISISRSTGDYFSLIQKISNIHAIRGKVVTFSMIKNSAFARARFIIDNTFILVPDMIACSVTDNLSYSVVKIPIDADEVMVAIETSVDSAVVIAAAKLELGPEQTLCRNEGTAQNPVWVLNEIPDYWEELAKCQTSRADSTDTYANQEIAIINRNAGSHNSIYRGKYLGSSVTAEQYAAINAGTFDDLYIGDYWTINNVNYRIAAFDYWLHCGDTECTTHHAVIVPDTRLYNAQIHNTESGAYTEGAANNPVTGAYVGSDMYTTNLAQAKTIVSNAFGSAHILNHREYLKNAVNGAYESAGAWYDSTVELMTEQMVYGGKIFANCMQAGNWAAQYTIDKSQLPLFALEPSRICIRAYWWLRDVASSALFALVYYTGFACAYYSSYSFGVRPAFGIKA